MAMSDWEHSFPRPAKTEDWQHIAPRSLVPISLPPPVASPPPPPSPPRQPSFAADYTLSTHIVPAAWPRTTPYLPAPLAAVPGESKDARAARSRSTVQAVLDSRAEYEAGTFGEQRDERTLWSVVNRYVRRDLGATKSTGLTLFFAHANGFPKELWEPTIQYMLHHARQSGRDLHIDEIWSWEAVQHGDAALLNADNLGGLYDWSDNTRDILAFLLHFLPSTPTAHALPAHLAGVSASEVAARKTRGLPGRTLVGLGHSFGGCTTAYAALAHPALFSALVLVDPVITAKYGGDRTIGPVVLGAVQRRTEWPGREAALKALKTTPFFASWDDRVLEVYVECALAEQRDGRVRLKMTGEQEGILYEQRTAREVYEQLDGLDARIALKWIMPTETSIFGGEEWHAQQRVWRRPANASNVRVESGHLIPMEAPKELAREICAFLLEKYDAPKKGAGAKL